MGQPFLEVVIAVLTAISIGMSIAFRRTHREAAHLRADVEALASHDSLTGALNRAAFEDAFHAWVGNGMHRRADSALVLIDVDHLHRINQQHGHEAGDEALHHLSTIISECVRETDSFGRLEGDEFGVLFPATNGGDALIAAERIRSTVAKRSTETGVSFTVSVGVAGGDTFSDPWSAAARAVELAKAAGTNRVVLADTETEFSGEFTDELHELPQAA